MVQSIHEAKRSPPSRGFSSLKASALISQMRHIKPISDRMFQTFGFLSRPKCLHLRLSIVRLSLEELFGNVH